MGNVKVTRTGGHQISIAQKLLLVCGILLFCATVFFGLLQLRETLVWVMLPRQFDKIYLDRPGTYTVFHEETWDFGDGLPKPTEADAKAIDFQISKAERGSAVDIPLQDSHHWIRYRIGSRGGYALYDFEINAPGEYSFRGTYADLPLDEGKRVVFVIAHNFRGRVFRLALVSLVACSFPVLLAFWLRRRAARER